MRRALAGPAIRPRPRPSACQGGRLDAAAAVRGKEKSTASRRPARCTYRRRELHTFVKEIFLRSYGILYLEILVVHFGRIYSGNNQTQNGHAQQPFGSLRTRDPCVVTVRSRRQFSCADVRHLCGPMRNLSMALRTGACAGPGPRAGLGQASSGRPLRPQEALRQEPRALPRIQGLQHRECCHLFCKLNPLMLDFCRVTGNIVFCID